MKVNEIHRLVIEAGENFTFRFDPSPHVNPNAQSAERTLFIHAPTCASVAGAVGVLKQKPPKNSFLLRSTHLVLGKDGRTIVQLIPFHTGANHASGFNNRSIAIDLEYPGELLEKGADFQLRKKFPEDQYILASGLSNSRYGYWPLYPRDQLDSLLVIARTLMKQYRIVDIVAYDELLTATHPGPAFPILHFREKLLGVTDRSILLQETSRSVLLLGQPEEESTLLSETRIPRGTPVSVINEKGEWYLISVIEEVGGNPWLIGWVEKNAVRVKTDFVPVVSPDKHYLTTAEGRRFPVIPPHKNGFEEKPLMLEPEAPKYIIMHFTTGTKMESTINHFKDPSSGVSTHLLIGRDGRVVQFLPFNQIAHHSGFSWWEQQSHLNTCSIGIELDNAGLLRGKRGNWQRHKIIIPDKDVQQDVHWKQYVPKDPTRYPGWQKFTKVQLDVALKIVQALVERYKSIKEILGHDDVNMRNRYDPGPLFPMERFRQKLFGRKRPEIDEHLINHQTDVYSNFGGRLPNPKQTTFDAPLPAKSLVRVIRREEDFALVAVIKSGNPKIKGTGWVQTASLEDSPVKGGAKAGKKKKAKKLADRRKTTISQPFFKRSENSPTPKLDAGPFDIGTRVRIQEFRGDWALVVMLDRIKGQGGLEGWMPKEFLSPKGEMIALTAAEEGIAPGLVSSVPLWQHKEDNGVFGGPRKCAPCPAVFPMQDSTVAVTKQWQFFVRAINMGMSVEEVAALFGPKKAFTNRNPNSLCADYLQGENLDRPDPVFDKVRTCSLSVMTGVVSGDELIVEMMDGSKPPPLKEGKTHPERVEDINPDDYLYTPQTHRHLFFAANIIRPNGKTISFPNGAVYDWTNDGRPYTWMPHVKRAQFVVRYPLSRLMRLPKGAPIPSPYRM